MDLAPLFDTTGSVILIALSCGLIFSALAVPQVRKLSQRIEQNRPKREEHSSLKAHFSGIFFGGAIGAIFGLLASGVPAALDGWIAGALVGEIIGLVVADQYHRE